MHKRLFLYLVIVSTLMSAGCHIEGRIVDGNGQGIADVTVHLSGGVQTRVATTDTNGWYCFGNPANDDSLPAGNYLITPVLSGFSFTPDNKTVPITTQIMGDYGDVSLPVAGVDFIGTTSSNDLIPPTMISPIPSSSLPSSTTTFIWDPGGYTYFYVYILTMYGTYTSDTMTENSITIINLPTDGTLVGFRLYCWDGVEWGSNAYIYYAFQETSNTISSYIVSDFDGLEEGKIFKLANGQYWKQTEYFYYYKYSYLPDVIIYQSGGSFLMKVEGIDKAVRVVELDPYVESRINGTFHGWDGDTVVELTNGQVWEQTEFYLELDLSLYADVMVYYDSGYKMWVEGIDESVGVERIR